MGRTFDVPFFFSNSFVSPFQLFAGLSILFLVLGVGAVLGCCRSAEIRGWVWRAEDTSAEHPSVETFFSQLRNICNSVFEKGQYDL